MTEKEYVWLDKELADQLKDAESDGTQAKVVLDIIKNKAVDFKEEFELLSESELRFKAVCLTHKTKLQEVYNVQSELLYKMWEDMGDTGSEIHKHAEKLASELSPIRQEVSALKHDIQELKSLMGSFHIYDAEKLLGLATHISEMRDGTKDILKFLLNNYKKPEA